MRSELTSTLAPEVVRHHLKLMGLPADGRVSFTSAASGADAAAIIAGPDFSTIHVALQPLDEFVACFGVSAEGPQNCREYFLQFTPKFAAPEKLRTLHDVTYFCHEAGQAIVSDANGRTIWLWLPLGQGGVLFVGSDLAGDLIRVRQGDSERAHDRPVEPLWGIAGERPNYLFDTQLLGQDSSARQADWWTMALAETLAQKLGRPLAAILPGGAPGAIVITGDDDQAYLEKYDEQLRLLGDIPITYLLHPLTRHTRKTLKAMQGKNPGVDFGIHPDALDAPTHYDKLFDEQVTWYRGLTGADPISLRNHGFLNDGYWGHLDAWIKTGVKISSNLPGLDGRVLNGSLLPARMAWRGQLTDHWSVLTVIGDGVRFASGMSDKEAADRVWSVADGVRLSKLPGVMVLNLHPQNVSETRAMHQAAIEIIKSGFVAWNLRQCWEWFAGMDQSISPRIEVEPRGTVSRVWTALRRLAVEARAT